ncbi:MAG: transcription antitermination factor NusB [Calditrichaeota bacterium]|nr:MAG: transcription antitermination factor NusB [Calditrichota bacterium]
MSRRRRARELALQACYAEEMTRNPVNMIIEDLILSQEDEEDIRGFAVQLFKCGAQRKQEADALIMEKAKNWDFTRIAILDKLIMRLAICEFLHFEDIPPKVSIDEAIELAKKYSTAKSGKFINGVLDGILVDLRRQRRIKKSGRGLIED